MQIDITLGVAINLIVYFILPGLAFIAARPSDVEAPQAPIKAWFTHSLPLILIPITVTDWLGLPQLTSGESLNNHMDTAWMPILAIMAVSWFLGFLWYSRAGYRLRLWVRGIQDSLASPSKAGISIRRIADESKNIKDTDGLVTAEIELTDGSKIVGSVAVSQVQGQLYERKPILIVNLSDCGDPATISRRDVHVHSIMKIQFRSHVP